MAMLTDVGDELIDRWELIQEQDRENEWRLREVPDSDPVPATFYSMDATSDTVTLVQDLSGLSINNQERSTSMDEIVLTVRDAVHTLENLCKTEKYPEGIVVPHDYGNHSYCLMDTNCPEAVKIRKVLDEAGIKLEELVELWKARRPEPPSPPFRYRDIDISGKVRVTVLGQNAELDVGEELQWQIRDQMERKYEAFLRYKNHFDVIAREMFHNYRFYFDEARRTSELPQIVLPMNLMMQYKCMVTTVNKEYYAFIFPFHYEPEYIFTNGDMYRIHKEHREEIVRDVYILLPIYPSLDVGEPMLILEDGRKFAHYHGHGYDCWGRVKILRRWDRELKSLWNYVKELEKSQGVINRDSLMTEQPHGMPSFTKMFSAAKLLGKEGEYKKGRGSKDVDDDEPVNTKDKKLWGGDQPEEQQEER